MRGLFLESTMLDWSWQRENPPLDPRRLLETNQANEPMFKQFLINGGKPILATAGFFSLAGRWNGRRATWERSI